MKDLFKFAVRPDNLMLILCLCLFTGVIAHGENGPTPKIVVGSSGISDGSVTNAKLSEPVSVANGGTGKTTAAEALAALGGMSTTGSTASISEWIDLPLLNDWVEASGWEAGYYRNIDGRVYLRGLVTSGTFPGVIAVLPPGFRPSQTTYLAVLSNNALGFLSINTSGEIYANIGSNVWVSLDQISYRAEL